MGGSRMSSVAATCVFAVTTRFSLILMFGMTALAVSQLMRLRHSATI